MQGVDARFVISARKTSRLVEQLRQNLSEGLRLTSTVAQLGFPLSTRSGIYSRHPLPKACRGTVMSQVMQDGILMQPVSEYYIH